MDTRFSTKLPKRIHTRIWGCRGYPQAVDIEKDTNTRRHAKRYTRRWIRRLSKKEIDEGVRDADNS